MKELTVLAEDINNSHELASSSARMAVEYAIKTGTLLLDAKKHVKHGQWEAWVKNNCAFAERTAQKYMRLSNAPRKAVLDKNLGINAALEYMAKPKSQKEVSNIIDINWLPVAGQFLHTGIDMFNEEYGEEFYILPSIKYSGYYYLVRQINVMSNGSDSSIGASISWKKKPMKIINREKVSVHFRLPPHQEWHLIETEVDVINVLIVNEYNWRMAA